MSRSMRPRITRCLLAAALMLASSSASSYTIKGGQVMDDSGKPVQLRGVAWFGFETPLHTTHGLWVRNWKDMITQMQSLGFNAVRLPFCPQSLQAVSPGSIDYRLNPDLQGMNSLQLMDTIIKELSSRGMYILLDQHSPDCNTITELWYTDSYSEQQWLADLTFVAKRYANVPGVIGLDLKNEPHGAATWGTGNTSTDWNSAAERASAVVLNAAPRWLIIVEGIYTNPSCSSNTAAHFWGEDLEPLACTPLKIPADHLLLTPHIYGPDGYMQSYFNDPNFPNNMKAIWEQHFGQFVQAGYALVPGEFGGNYGQGKTKEKDVAWQNALVDYLTSKNIHGGFYWALNPNSDNIGGILNDDWTTVRTDKVAMLHKLWGTDGGGGGGGGGGGNGNSNGNGSGNFSTHVIVDSDWHAGYCERVQVTNTGNTAGNWELTMPISGKVNNLWNGNWKQPDTNLNVKGVDWNKTLPPSATAEFGFCAVR
ncbi:glycoside hydrolase family 5 protein [Xanthomonas albilineans]|uniref:cellulase family glycosylhydrolase n=1 Tax=Xanthomonas albilineans TaxID=29447 RepID=UPI0005F30B49